jgi:hypothetical protein
MQVISAPKTLSGDRQRIASLQQPIYRSKPPRKLKNAAVPPQVNNKPSEVRHI